ncbi:hypothetical protein ACJ73_01765 [Blastomyces percursus]|uniref:Uncharacterized protein n=1 Tax=Blastomyces percursus TaxID=1658174 RepID=A0A1J9RFS1_9EURO|nr:hypothetical protein ACJ73_01765 [Blastomyces percursus]
MSPSKSAPTSNSSQRSGSGHESESDWSDELGTRQNMIEKELGGASQDTLLQEHFVHGSPPHGPFPQATWSLTEAIRKRDAEEDAATEKLHDRSQSKVESKADGGWDECFDRLYVW